MTTAPAFGRIIGADDVADAVLGQLQEWMTAYLAEKARQAGLDADTLPPIRSWDVLPTRTPGGEHEPPACLGVPEGIRGVVDDGTGKLAGQFQVAVVLLVESIEYHPAVRLIGRYTAAAAALLVQQRHYPDLPVTAVTLQRVDWSVRRRNRHQGEGVVTVGLHVPGIVDPIAGPADVPVPPTSTPADPPIATDVQVAVVHTFD